ncbi:MAG TPA: beta-L-arabinofuranosidase domain-containing protein, partial [Phycisphaerae bacterium]
FLTAASMMYASTGHAELKQRIDYILGELKDCQDAAKTGLINAFPDNDAQIQNLIAGRRATGVPWYTLHKIFAGLRDAHLFTDSDLAKDILVKLTDWAGNATKDMTDDAFQRMLGTEHGGMNEVLGDIYALTKNEKHLALAERFCHQQVLVPLAEGRDVLDGRHSNETIPKFVGFERLYQLTGKAQYHAAAEFFWKAVTGTRSFATGGNGDGEHFFAVNQFSQKLASAKTMETCCTHNMLKLTRLLFGRDPQAAYGDYYERALFNAILGSQDPDTGMVTYFQSTRPGYIKLFCTPFDSFWCCTGTGIENHAKYGDSIYFHSVEGTDTNAGTKEWPALYVNLFIASTLNWKGQGITVKQVTTFPEAGKTRLEITAAAPKEMTLHIRKPAWTSEASVMLNGGKVELSSGPAGYMSLHRTWQSGDVIEVSLPMAVHTELLPTTSDTVAILYGPLVLVGALGHQVKVGDDLTINERNIGTPLNEHVDVPTFSGDAAKIAEKIKPAGPPLTFKTEGLGKPDDVTLVPYYKMAHQHYNMYWKIQNA